MKRSVTCTQIFNVFFVSVLVCGKAYANREILPGEKHRLAGYILWDFIPPAHQIYHQQADNLWIQEADTEEVFLEENVPSPSKITRIHFPNFEVLLHDFMGYEKESDGTNVLFYVPYSNTPIDTARTKLVQNYRYDETTGEEFFLEYLKTSQDTLYISENLDERINNTRIEIVPHSSKDRFRMSMCYLSSVNEVIDDRGLSWEQVEKRYAAQEHLNEKTKVVALLDSAGYYFRALSHTPDMIAVEVVHDQIVPVKYTNTPEQIRQEQILYEEERDRLKKKYGFRDTLVVVPGEYDIVATLTKDSKLYNFTYDSFLFQIDRLQGKKVVESRWLVINIAYGC